MYRLAIGLVRIKPAPKTIRATPLSMNSVSLSLKLSLPSFMDSLLFFGMSRSLELLRVKPAFAMHLDSEPSRLEFCSPAIPQVSQPHRRQFQLARSIPSSLLLLRVFPARSRRA